MEVYLNKDLVKLKETPHDSLVQEFIRAAEKLEKMNRFHTSHFEYLNRCCNYMQIPKLRDTGMKLFQAKIFDNVKVDLTRALLQLIHDERNGILDNYDRERLKKCIQVYQNMGLGSLDLYQREFEQAFLRESR
jgi:cullin 1